MAIVKVIKLGEMPISEELAWQQLRVGSTPVDSHIIRIKLEAAIDWAERVTNRYIRHREIVVTGMTNSNGVMKMPVGSYDVKLLEADADTVWAYNEFHEAICIDGACNQKIKVGANVGYTSDDMPGSIIAAILMTLSTIYDNDSDQVVGRSVSQLTLTAKSLVAPYRITPYGDV